MPILTTQRKKQRNLIIVMVLVVMTTLFVLYFGILKNGGGGQGVLHSEINIFKNVREVRLNLGLLKEDRFLDLVPYSKLPTNIKTGRKNPFTPYDTPPSEASPEGSAELVEE